MTSSRPARTLARAAGAVPGAVLGVAAGVAAAVRRTKPLHPQGRVGDGVLHVLAPLPELGVPLLAEVGDRSCVVRWSRAMGCRRRCPTSKDWRCGSRPTRAAATC